MKCTETRGKKSPEPNLSLEPPNVYIFTGELCSQAYRLNRFAFDLKFGAVRSEFKHDPEGTMSRYDLLPNEKAMIRARDWTALVAHGGHMLAITKLANALGESHLHIGAHMCGESWEDLRKSLPREISLMPGDV